MRTTCSTFAQLLDEVRQNVTEMTTNIEVVVNAFAKKRDEQKRETWSAELDCQIAKRSLAREESHMRRVAVNVLDAEENTVIVLLNSLWLLSENVVNSVDIARSCDVICSVMNILASETNLGMIESCMGLFCNICAGPEARELFVEQYEGEQLASVIEAAKAITLSSGSHFDRSLELSVVFIHNLSLSDLGSVALLDNNITYTLCEALMDHQCNSNLVNMVVITLSNLYGDAQRITRLTPDLVSELTKSLSMFPATQAIVCFNTILSMVIPTDAFLSTRQGERDACFRPGMIDDS